MALHTLNLMCFPCNFLDLMRVVAFKYIIVAFACPGASYFCIPFVILYFSGTLYRLVASSQRFSLYSSHRPNGPAYLRSSFQRFSLHSSHRPNGPAYLRSSSQRFSLHSLHRPNSPAVVPSSTQRSSPHSLVPTHLSHSPVRSPRSQSYPVSYLRSS